MLIDLYNKFCDVRKQQSIIYIWHSLNDNACKMACM